MTENIELEAFSPLEPVVDVSVDVASLTQLIRQHEHIKKNMDMLNDRKSFVRTKIDELTVALGEEDSKGHVYVNIDDPLTGVSKVTRQRRVSKNLDQNIAYNILFAKKLHERCIKKIVVIDEEAIMAAYNEDLLTDEDIDKMFPEKITWATVIK
jgi:hypothetical protein